MLGGMDTAWFVEAVAGHRGDPGQQDCPDDTLRALLAAMELVQALCRDIARETSSPTEAALYARAVEHHSQLMEFTQIRAAQLAEQTLMHELPPQTFTELRSIADDPADYVQGRTSLPEDPRTPPTGRLEFKTTADALQGTLGISYYEARDRLHAAWSLLPRTDINGIPRGPRFPVLAGHLDSGAARVKDVTAAARKLDKLRPSIEARPDAGDLARRVEEQVARSVAEETPRDTNKLFDAISEKLEAANAAPTPAEIREKTGIFIIRRTRHFTYLSACMLNEDAEIFLSHFAQSDNPRTLAGNRPAMADAATVPGSSLDSSRAAGATPDAPEPPPWFIRDPAHGPTETLAPPNDFDFSSIFKDQFNTTAPGADGFTPPQRHLQTLINIMRTANHPPGINGIKGATGNKSVPAGRLLVMIQFETLMGLARGSGYTAHGLEMPVSRVRSMLANDGVIPVVLGGEGEILDVGRERRLLPEPLKRAVLARDGGCLFPGCTVPPELCEFNHIQQWQDGGTTSVGNCHAVCTGHHRMIDNGEATIVIHHGLPHLVLPAYLDPEQLPRRNTYWKPAAQTLF